MAKEKQGDCFADYSFFILHSSFFTFPFSLFRHRIPKRRPYRNDSNRGGAGVSFRGFLSCEFSYGIQLCLCEVVGKRFQRGGVREDGLVEGIQGRGV